MKDCRSRVESVVHADVDSEGGGSPAIFTFAKPGSDAIAAPVSDDALNRSVADRLRPGSAADDFALDGLAYYYRDWITAHSSNWRQG